VLIGGGYAEYVNRCMAEFSSRMDKYSPANRSIDPWVPVNYSAPEVLVAYVRSILASGSPETWAALGTAKLAHVRSFLRALFPPQILKSPSES